MQTQRLLIIPTYILVPFDRNSTIPSANSDKLKGQMGILRFIQRLMEQLPEIDDLQFEPTIVAIENQLEVVKGLNSRARNQHQTSSWTRRCMFLTLKRSFENAIIICETTHLQVEQPFTNAAIRRPKYSH